MPTLAAEGSTGSAMVIVSTVMAMSSPSSLPSTRTWLMASAPALNPAVIRQNAAVMAVDAMESVAASPFSLMVVARPVMVTVSPLSATLSYPVTVALPASMISMNLSAMAFPLASKASAGTGRTSGAASAMARAEREVR